MLETAPWKVKSVDQFYKDYHTYSVYFMSTFFIFFVVIKLIIICSQTNTIT